jgi:iron complex outermembrane receptor protein
MSNNLTKVGARAPVAFNRAARARSRAMASAAGVLWGALGLAGAALAQTAAPAPAPPGPAKAQDSSVLQEVVVTAEKRSANLQNVPIAITAISGTDAALKGVTGTTALTAIVPGLVLVSPANVANPYLRGVGSNLFDPSAENSVSIFVDGVYIAAPQADLFNFNNIAGIEVLKGPQGTLFGRNATGGVVQITTKTPSQAPSGDFSIGYGDYDDVTVAGYGTTGLSDFAAIDLAFLYENQGEGYGRNFTTGAETFRMAVGNYSIRSKLLLTPTTTTKILIAVDYSHSISTPAYQFPQGHPSPIDGETYPGPFNTRSDETDENRVDTGGASIQVDQELGPTRLTSITSYRQSKVDYGLDDDVTELPVVDLQLNTRQHNYSEEIRLANRDNGWLTWVVGGYFYGNDGGYFPAGIIDVVELNEDKQTSWSYAGFTQATAKLPFQTELTLGGRYTDEEQDFLQNYPVSYGTSQRFDKFTYRIALDHHFTNNVSGYVSYDTGFKTGGYNLLISVPPPSASDPHPTPDVYKPEVLDATEVGLKTELFGRRLRLNADAFLYQYQNIQIDVPYPGGNLVENAAAAHIKGVEGDFQWLPISHLTVSGGVSLLDGKYTNLAAGVGKIGNKTVVTPPVSGSISVNYLYSRSWGSLRPAITASYNSGFYFQPSNDFAQPAYTLVNGSVTYTVPDAKYDLKLWVKNLTDATYYIARLDNGAFGFSQEQAPPRTFGFTATAHF